MIKLCLIRGLRIVLMLLLIGMLSLVTVCLLSPNISWLKTSFESMVKKELHASVFEVSSFQLAWDSGPALQLGALELVLPTLHIEKATTSLSFPLFSLFYGNSAPTLRMTGGSIAVNLDASSDTAFQLPNVHVLLKDMQIGWSWAQEKHHFAHSDAVIRPYLAHVSLRNSQLDFSMALDTSQHLTACQLKLDDFSMLPKAWRDKLPLAKQLSLNIQATSTLTWDWSVRLLAAHGGKIALPSIHVVIPFEQLQAQGSLALKDEENLALALLDVASLQWENQAEQRNFVQAKLHWQDDLLQIEVSDGATSMPMLWSWLWMLGEQGFQQWLGLMQHGRLEDVQATLALPWSTPLSAAPTDADVQRMTYHVRTHTKDADIALGLAGDFLWHTDADVEIDHNHLTAHMNSTDLDQHSGRIEGDFAIDWQTLMMTITGQGVVDVGKLHAWLDKDAAKALRWGKAPAFAELDMRWDVDADGPEKGIVRLKPKSAWALRPYDIPLITRQGLAIWDVNKGLTIEHMQAHSPWLDGKVSMFLDSRDDWNMKSMQLSGYAPLAQLTKQFSLPIAKPQGQTKLALRFNDLKWTGNLDFSASDWTNFLGYEKAKGEDFRFDFHGLSGKSSLLPVHIEQLQSNQQNFQLHANIGIREDTLEFHFKDMKTPAFVGDFRLHMPLNPALPWGMEVKADLVDKAAFAMYFHDLETEEAAATNLRPWSLYADVSKLKWESSYAEKVKFQFSSDEKSVGNVVADHLKSGDLDLQQLSAAFTMLEHGKFDLHLLEANGSGQHLRVSGSVQPLASGALQWQGLVLMNGKFGTLMHQAELDQLFQEGDMSALFLGKGAFVEGQPWYTGMQGRFRLLVEDGRMMQGGTLTRLLAAISLVDLPKYLIFQRDDVLGDGLLYEKMLIEANFDEEQLHINELAFRSSALDAGGKGMVDLATGDLDILLIARPWQNMESLLGNIPLLGYILTGKDKSLLRKVYRIHGPASDAEVDDLDPEDAGLPRSGLLEHLFSLPSQWFGD